MINYLKILEKFDCSDSGFQMIMKIIKWAYNGLCIIVPIVIIVLIIVDVTKVAISGKLDDKVKKESTNTAITRIVCAVIIFLVPTVVNLIFRILPISDDEVYVNCWDGESTIK